MLLSVRSDNFIFRVNFIFQVNFICQVNFFFVVGEIKELCFSSQLCLSSQLLLLSFRSNNFVCCRIILTSFLCRGREGRGGGGENYELSVLEDFRAQRPHRVLQRPRHGLHVSTHVQSPKVICTSSEISPNSPGFNSAPQKVNPDYCPT